MKYTAILVQQTKNGLMVIGQKEIQQDELDELIKNGVYKIQRHVKCPRLITLIMN